MLTALALTVSTSEPLWMVGMLETKTWSRADDRVDMRPIQNRQCALIEHRVFRCLEIFNKALQRHLIVAVLSRLHGGAFYDLRLLYTS